MKPLPQWLVTIGGRECVVRITDEGIELRSGPGGPLLAGSTLEACRLGMALTEASGIAGQLAARRR